jgi:hypothetical protein
MSNKPTLGQQYMGMLDVALGKEGLTHRIPDFDCSMDFEGDSLHTKDNPIGTGVREHRIERHEKRRFLWDKKILVAKIVSEPDYMESEHVWDRGVSVGFSELAYRGLKIEMVLPEYKADIIRGLSQGPFEEWLASPIEINGVDLNDLRFRIADKGMEK